MVLLSALLAVAWLTTAAARQPSGPNPNSSGSNSQSADSKAPPTSGATGTTGSQGGNSQGDNSQGDGSQGDNSQGDTPQYGATVEVGQSTGTVSVTLPGQAKAVPVGNVNSLPVGAEIDATHGKVVLTSAVDSSGRTQTASFWGGVFSVRQPKQPGGYTVIVLPKVRRASCPSRGKAMMARRRRRPVHLWAEDHHGRYRTRGQNSVATVRGTRWLTVERCDGTLTHVSRGAVSVRDLHRHRTVLVKAHHSYLARG